MTEEEIERLVDAKLDQRLGQLKAEIVSQIGMELHKQFITKIELKEAVVSFTKGFSDAAGKVSERQQQEVMALIHNDQPVPDNHPLKAWCDLIEKAADTEWRINELAMILVFDWISPKTRSPDFMEKTMKLTMMRNKMLGDQRDQVIKLFESKNAKAGASGELNEIREELLELLRPAKNPSE